MTTTLARYLTPAEHTAHMQWQAALDAWMRHNAEAHPDGIERRCADCSRHCREEHLKFARVEAHGGDGLITALEDGWR